MGIVVSDEGAKGEKCEEHEGFAGCRALVTILEVSGKHEIADSSGSKVALFARVEQGA